jgi:putative addiction module killer protein
MQYAIQQTATFVAWHKDMRDLRARIAIGRRIERASMGNFGDVEPVGNGVSEMKIDVGAGYRVYFVKHGSVVIILLCGGNKKSQKADIKKAKAMAKDFEA